MGRITAAPMFVDNVCFSNAATVEHNVLGPGEVGHILRSRTTTVAGGAYAPADAWFAFNQVGSVVNHSNAAGAMTQAVEMDAWGNTLASAASGAWATDQTGWKHSTKRLDPLAGVTYAHARWSDVSVGTWLSRDPIGVHGGANLYSYVYQSPLRYVDLNGLWGEDVHYGDTYAACLMAGGSREFCDTVAASDSGFDSGLTWPGMNPRPHFPLTLGDPVSEALAAIGECDAVAFGRALHRVQDYWSHTYPHNGEWAKRRIPNHKYPGDEKLSPDDKSAYPYEHSRAMRLTRELLKRFIDACGGRVKCRAISEGLDGA